MITIVSHKSTIIIEHIANKFIFENSISSVAYTRETFALSCEIQISLVAKLPPFYVYPVLQRHFIALILYSKQKNFFSIQIPNLHLVLFLISSHAVCLAVIPLLLSEGKTPDRKNSMCRLNTQGPSWFPTRPPPPPSWATSLLPPISTIQNQINHGFNPLPPAMIGSKSLWLRPLPDLPPKWKKKSWHHKKNVCTMSSL